VIHGMLGMWGKNPRKLHLERNPFFWELWDYGVAPFWRFWEKKRFVSGANIFLSKLPKWICGEMLGYKGTVWLIDAKWNHDRLKWGGPKRSHSPNLQFSPCYLDGLDHCYLVI
jgi:hypothetical protein